MKFFFKKYLFANRVQIKDEIWGHPKKVVQRAF